MGRITARCSMNDSPSVVVTCLTEARHCRRQLAQLAAARRYRHTGQGLRDWGSYQFDWFHGWTSRQREERRDEQWRRPTFRT